MSVRHGFVYNEDQDDADQGCLEPEKYEVADVQGEPVAKRGEVHCVFLEKKNLGV